MEQRIRIAFIITRLCAGGASQAIKEIAKILNREKYHLTLLYGHVSNHEVDISVDVVPHFDEHVRLKYMHRKFSFWKDHLACLEIQEILRTGAFDIVHTHTSKAGFVGRLAAKREKVKTVIHSTHGFIFADNADIPGVSGLKRHLFLFAERRAANWCHKICTLSELEIQSWRELKVGHDDKYVCLPSAVDVVDFENSRSKRDEIRKAKGILDSQKIILMLGRLAVEKGHKYAVEAMGLGIDAQLWIVGEGPEREVIEDSVSKSSSKNQITMMGNRNDVSSWISAVDVLILPSTYEGQGLVLIEAMAAGVAVIASDVGGVSEIINNEVNGLLVKAKDSEALHNSIKRLINDQHLRQSISKKALGTYPRYRPENICEKLENIYLSCSNVQKHIN